MDENSHVKIIANASTLVGGVRVEKSSIAALQLINGSQWILSRPRYEELQYLTSSHSQLKDYTSISSLDLVDSSLVFEELKSKKADVYQTLFVGKGSGKVYRAQGKTHLYLNTYLDKEGALQDQKTDRLLIYGDVSSETIVHVRSVLRSSGEYMEEHGNSKGISLIQVYGKAEEDSFQLNGGYITPHGSPYQYRLYAYGPGSHLGEANSAQRLVEGQEEFWDFRLASEFVLFSSFDYTDLLLVPDFTWFDDPSPPVSDFRVTTGVGDSIIEPKVLWRSSSAHPLSVAPCAPFSEAVRLVIPDNGARKKRLTASLTVAESGVFMPKVIFAFEPSSHFKKKVRAVVSQVPTYLFLPNSLLHAGVMDLNNQNKQLEVLRTVSRQLLKNDKNSVLFLNGYAGNYHYTSNLSALEYGHGGDLDYHAIEASILLRTIESEYSATSFGIMGIYGKISLQPRNIEQSQESTFDKWTVTAYSSMQHERGFYINGLFSYWSL
ncbi:Type V secretory pathway, adhesin AidA [Bartonella vinsonii]|uniref:Type V secretory pathway, adhesin AidA n=1 Tax=Bartonella vinsonii TaxID=33047 RepID=A0A3S5C0U0_BARVI|nr:Type V secretory pathway, adhesin AidA [Bartonella vinsonii]